MKLILTFDIEEYFQVENFKKVIPHSAWDTYPSRLEVGVDRILSVLADAKAKATFFMLGWCAERNRGLVRQIHAEGHEIASHGYAHTLVYRQTEKEFFDDVKHSIDLLSDITGERVTSYRAPCFSISSETPWAYEVLVELGITTDCSLFPVAHDRYGAPSMNRFPYVIHTTKGDLRELPVTTAEVFGTRIPFAGGGYFRLLPGWMIRALLESAKGKGQRAESGTLRVIESNERIVKSGGPQGQPSALGSMPSAVPRVLYFHPWEFDPAQPRVKGAGYIDAFRHYVGIAANERKLREVIANMPCVRVKDY